MSDSHVDGDIFKLIGVPEDASLGEVKMYARGYVKRHLPSLVADVTNTHFAESMRTFAIFKDPEKMASWKQEKSQAQQSQRSFGRNRFVVPLDGKLPVLNDTYGSHGAVSTIDPMLSAEVTDIAKSVLAAEPEFVVRYAQAVATYNSIDRGRARDDFLGVDEFGSDLHSRAVADLILARASAELVKGSHASAGATMRVEAYAELAEQMALHDAPALSIAGDDGIGRRVTV